MRGSKKDGWYNPETRQLALDIAPPHNKDEAMARAMRQLPDSEIELIAEARRSLAAYDVAVRGYDDDVAEEHETCITAIALKMNRDDPAIREKGASIERLAEALRVDDGSVPIFGQPGRFLVTIEEDEEPVCRVIVDYQGLFGISPHGFSCHAIDFDRPFISETGYKSIHPRIIHYRDAEAGVEVFCREEIEKSRMYDPRGFYGYKPCRLVPIEKDRRHPPSDDPQWKPGGWIEVASKNPLPVKKRGRSKLRRR